MIGLRAPENTMAYPPRPDPGRALGAALRRAIPLLLVPLFACGGTLLGPDAEQGIDGLVLLGPVCPVQSAEDPCPDVPYVATITITDPGGRLVGIVESGEDGRFRVGLRAGQYVLDPQSGDPWPSANEQIVTVDAGRYTEVVVSFDTGIR